MADFDFQPGDTIAIVEHWAMPEVTRRLAVNWAEIELDLRDAGWKP